MVDESKFFEDFEQHKDLSEYADEFCEGDELLRHVLLTLWNHRIKTAFCCKGHDDDSAYIAFPIDKDNVNYIKNLISTLCSSKMEFYGTLTYNNYYQKEMFAIRMRDDVKSNFLNLLINEALFSDYDENNKNNKLIRNMLHLSDISKSRNYMLQLDISQYGLYMVIGRSQVQVCDDGFVQFSQNIYDVDDDYPIECVVDDIINYLNDQTDLMGEYYLSVEEFDKLLSLLHSSKKLALKPKDTR